MSENTDLEIVIPREAVNAENSTKTLRLLEEVMKKAPLKINGEAFSAGDPKGNVCLAQQIRMTMEHHFGMKQEVVEKAYRQYLEHEARDMILCDLEKRLGLPEFIFRFKEWKGLLHETATDFSDYTVCNTCTSFESRLAGEPRVMFIIGSRHDRCELRIRETAGSGFAEWLLEDVLQRYREQFSQLYVLMTDIPYREFRTDEYFRNVKLGVAVSYDEKQIQLHHKNKAIAEFTRRMENTYYADNKKQKNR